MNGDALVFAGDDDMQCRFMRYAIVLRVRATAVILVLKGRKPMREAVM